MTAKVEHVLLVFTVIAGTVDAISYLGLGHVFVVNMTGNIIFLSFAAAGSNAVSLPAVVTALIAFAGGSVVGGRLAKRLGSEPHRLLRTAATIKLALIAIAIALVAVQGDVERSGLLYAIVGLLAVAMGLQNAVARKVGVPDLTTTVLTMTWTGIAADSPLGGGKNPRLVWRLSSVIAMLVGAFIGAVCLIHAGLMIALVATATLLIVAAALSVLVRPDPAPSA